MKTINKDNEAALKHEYLTSILDYNPETGDFIWKTKMSTRAMPNSIAGSLKPTGYIIIKINGRSYLAHRLAWFYTYKKWPNATIDHIDRNPSNNSIANLRDVNNSTNMRNRGLTHKNTSGVTGVTYEPSRNRWKAQITINNKQIHLGYFMDLKFAIKARREAELKYHS